MARKSSKKRTSMSTTDFLACWLKAEHIEDYDEFVAMFSTVSEIEGHGPLSSSQVAQRCSAIARSKRFKAKYKAPKKPERKQKSTSFVLEIEKDEKGWLEMGLKRNS